MLFIVLVSLQVTPLAKRCFNYLQLHACVFYLLPGSKSQLLHQSKVSWKKLSVGGINYLEWWVSQVGLLTLEWATLTSSIIPLKYLRLESFSSTPFLMALTYYGCYTFSSKFNLGNFGLSLTG